MNTLFSTRKSMLWKPPNECQECGEQLVCRSTLICHQSIHNREKGLSESQEILYEKPEHREHPRICGKRFKCNKCEKTFHCRKYLTQHKLIHARVKPFECNHCGKAFGQSSHLIRHQKIHSRLRSYRCGDCGKAFIYRTSLIKHQSLHVIEHPFKCNECGRIFSQSACLLEHQLIHTTKKPLIPNKCDSLGPQ